MTPSDNGKQQDPLSDAKLTPPRTRDSSLRRRSPPAVTELPYRPPNASLSTLFTPGPAQSMSGSRGANSPGNVTASTVSTNGSSGIPVPPPSTSKRKEEPLSLIAQSFVPHVAVLASSDAEHIVKEKGLSGGLLQLVRPFGESIPGKVTIRDSNGASKSWEDFGIRFTSLRDGLEPPRLPNGRSLEQFSDQSNGVLPTITGSELARLRTGGDIAQIEEVVDRHLSFAEIQSRVDASTLHAQRKDSVPGPSHSISPFYTMYLRRLLSGLPMSPHETFSHPVACVIAISSRSKSPIEELRRLYASTNTGDNRLPQWVNNDYLRYYLLIHDEDNDDITKSTGLYEQMKRHFGLHCHLLRLRSNQCIASDDDSSRLPACEWLSAAEVLLDIQKRETADDWENMTPCIFESDATAIITFVREMVTQSIVPFMERLSATWNEQVASRRRGLSGRFISLSKRFAPFSSSRSTSGSLGGQVNPGSNYDSLQGFYRPDAPEATMRKLADFAFMLRDLKLAQSTYDLLRSDFNNDKAWKYYAGANEMTAISTLLVSRAASTRVRAEDVDQMLDTAYYSYLTRCASPYNASRALTLGLELLKLHGPSTADNAARWASKIVETNLLGPTGNALYTERVEACYKGRNGFGSMHWGNRQRKSAMWGVLAAESWLRIEKVHSADERLSEAIKLYGIGDSESTPLSFDLVRRYIQTLQDDVAAASPPIPNPEGEDDGTDDEPPQVEEVSEKFEHRSHRKSLIGAPARFNVMDAGPLSPRSGPYEEPGFQDHNFE